MAKFTAAIGRIVSVLIGHWIALTAATPNVASWVAPQDGWITGIWFIVDTKTAITVLQLMAELNGTNILSAVVDMNAAAVRTPTAGTLGGALVTADGLIPVTKDQIVTLDVDGLTGTSCQGVQMQIDFLAK